ncbi:MAG: isoleucine--tRNA ligase [Planctomycetes bacterium]|nr:isoleucine--tRNA ligase [Planctomycetota bacterium]
MTDSDRRSATHYPNVDPQASFPAIERDMLAFWEREGIFRESIAARPESDEYVFYDGPPFANGLPHYGHLLTGYVKDVVPRYQTMRGKRVERRFGWDCHGLPAELEAEKVLGISGRQKILEHGMGEFNETCRTAIWKYTKEWQSFVARQARWVDFDNEYRTMDASYMESVLWAFKALYDKGLLYEDYRVMPYSWAAETPLSNFETRLDNSYRERQDPAITVRFTLAPADGDTAPTDLLAWTTTPWTLPSNLAIAVGPDIDYAVFDLDGRRVILGALTVAKFERELEGANQVGSVKGSELVGRTYEPLFPFFSEQAGAFRVLAADFVDTEDGTGIVHMAPGFGEDDMDVCKANDIGVVVPVDSAGRFTAEVEPWAGQLVFDTNKPITQELKQRGVLFKHETYLHNYPHCWRTDQPLIYKAVTSWYVRVTELSARMVELNKEIHWIPGHIRDGLFGKWLEGARDWSISRNRFWGSPIPVWKSDDPRYPRLDVYGSIDELERDFGVRLVDLHRPGIDELTRPNPDDPSGNSTMRRVEDVLDCWFESGSMPYAQVHYPFEHREWFESHFPGDFVVEYTAQTRGWFYTMLVLATALFERPPFRNVICHGTILDENAQKLSKRLRNYPNPDEVFETSGADALRWYLMSSPLMRGGDLQMDREGKAIAEIVRLVLNPIWNAYYFFTLYANADGVTASVRTDQDGVLDRYILAKTGVLITDVTRRLDDYDLAGTCQSISTFVDALNNWWIRRSRDRFWKQELDAEKTDAYDTLFTVLTTLCKVAAPMLPLLTEAIYKGLTTERSVHLADWPDAGPFPVERELVHSMDRVREVCSTALALRRAKEIRVRQPLRRLTVAGADVAGLAPFRDLIADELNVKEVVLETDIEKHATFSLQVNARALGPRLGAKTKEVIAASKRGEWTRNATNGIDIAGHTLEEGEFQLQLCASDETTCGALPRGDAVVALDTDLDDDLIAEGKARDVVRAVQQARRDAELNVADRIKLSLSLPDDLLAATEQFRDWVGQQTLAVELTFDGAFGGASEHSAEVGGAPARIWLRKA